MLANELEQLASVAGLANDLEAGALEEAREPLTEEHLVIRHHHSRPGRGHTDDYAAPVAARSTPWRERR